MNMHAMNMWLTDAATVVVGADWTLHPWRHNNVGDINAARRDTTQVMLGCHCGPGETQSYSYGNTCLPSASCSRRSPVTRPYLLTSERSSPRIRRRSSAV